MGFVHVDIKVGNPFNGDGEAVFGWGYYSTGFGLDG